MSEINVGDRIVVRIPGCVLDGEKGTIDRILDLNIHDGHSAFVKYDNQQYFRGCVPVKYLRKLEKKKKKPKFKEPKFKIGDTVKVREGVKIWGKGNGIGSIVDISGWGSYVVKSYADEDSYIYTEDDLCPHSEIRTEFHSIIFKPKEKSECDNLRESVKELEVRVTKNDNAIFDQNQSSGTLFGKLTVLEREEIKSLKDSIESIKQRINEMRRDWLHAVEHINEQQQDIFSLKSRKFEARIILLEEDSVSQTKRINDICLSIDMLNRRLEKIGG